MNYNIHSTQNKILIPLKLHSVRIWRYFTNHCLLRIEIIDYFRKKAEEGRIDVVIKWLKILKLKRFKDFGYSYGYFLLQLSDINILVVVPKTNTFSAYPRKFGLLLHGKSFIATQKVELNKLSGCIELEYKI